MIGKPNIKEYPDSCKDPKAGDAMRILNNYKIIKEPVVGACFR